MIRENLQCVQERIAKAAARVGRQPEEIALVAVTKTVGVAQILEAIEAGITDIGENYVQDAAKKLKDVGRRVRWHMIGHLQTNKARPAVEIFELIQSVDSLKLANELGRRSVEVGKTSDVLIQVNISGEESKFGVSPDAALDLAGEVAKVGGVVVKGLMGIGPLTDNEAVIRRSFRLLKEIYDRLPPSMRKWLSMGMTSDFELAIEEGSNMVRIGTAIFGPRN